MHCVGRMQISVIYTNSVRTSQETHYISATKPHRLMLFRETVAVYCESHTEHTNALCGQNADIFNFKAGEYMQVAVTTQCCKWLRILNVFYCILTPQNLV
jgi:hypothetical protein